MKGNGCLILLQQRAGNGTPGSDRLKFLAFIADSESNRAHRSTQASKETLDWGKLNSRECPLLAESRHSGANWQARHFALNSRSG